MNRQTGREGDNPQLDEPKCSSTFWFVSDDPGAIITVVNIIFHAYSNPQLAKVGQKLYFRLRKGCISDNLCSSVFNDLANWGS